LSPTVRRQPPPQIELHKLAGTLWSLRRRPDD
jgi:hypothetical protein